MKVNRVGVMAALAIAIVFSMIGAAHADSGITLTREAQAAITPDKAIEMGNAASGQLPMVVLS
jgi:hypothetical protein